MAARQQQQQQQQQQQFSGDRFTSHIAGMSKSQLYDIMSQLKVLIDQNQKQARQILIENPLLTRALFQMPNVQQQILPQSAQAGHKTIIQTGQPLSTQPGLQVQKNSQPSVPAKQQQPQYPSISIPPASVPPPGNYQSQQMISSPAHLAQQAKGFFSGPHGLPPHSSQIRNLSHPPHPHSHFPMLQSHVPMVSSQPQPSLQTPGMFHQPLQPPLPQQPRPPMQPFSHQLPSQMPHGLGFPPSSAPQHLLSPPLFHGGSLMSSDYRNPAGTFMHAERGPWIPGLTEKPTAGPLAGPSPPSLGQIATGPVGQPPRLPLLSPEMEKAVLQQVLMLTPEQINLLPPEQRNQVLEIQEILR
ncbi:hypothetical protein KFK09_017482 [Dendrobium nobile]|uniref:Cleavage stimulating factor 64 n=1 Tax=Dendrobium nobile TaxID=94219 RepID=A0A8T3B1G1_DENNO|nr:hypothetical protein KFK09_017482 [Dendrobium nobile]